MVLRAVPDGCITLIPPIAIVESALQDIPAFLEQLSEKSQAW